MEYTDQLTELSNKISLRMALARALFVPVSASLASYTVGIY
jgi:hypothetical protein